MVVSLPLSLVVLGGLRGGEEGGPEGMEREGTVDEDQQAKGMYCLRMWCAIFFTCTLIYVCIG